MPLDPVCGMNVDPANAAGAFDYKGTKYYFCSKPCHQSFMLDPQRYLGGKDGHAHDGHDSGHHAASIPVAAKPSTSPDASRDRSSGAGLLSQVRHDAGAHGPRGGRSGG